MVSPTTPPTTPRNHPSTYQPHADPLQDGLNFLDALTQDTAQPKCPDRPKKSLEGRVKVDLLNVGILQFVTGIARNRIEAEAQNR